MDLQNNHKPNPFKVPEGYFDNFESRLSERLQASQQQTPLKVSRSKTNTGVWLSAAAAVLLLLVNGWVFWGKLVPAEKEVQVVAERKIQAPAITVPVVKNNDTMMVVSIDEIVEEVLETATSTNAAIETNNELSSNDKLIALELEESGLLVADLEEDLFEEFDIIP